MKTILIIGATSGIGFELTKIFLKKNYRVTCLGRNFIKLDEFVKKNNMQKFYQKKKIDLREYFKTKTIKKFSNYENIVCCVGSVNDNLIRFYSPSKFQEMIEINLIKPINFICELFKNNKIKQDGRIVIISSLLGSKMVRPGSIGYASAKAGIIAASKVMALEMSKNNIRVNTVSPGMIENRFVKKLKNISDNDIKNDKQLYPLEKRYVKQNEVCELIIYLLSKKSSFITGEDIIIDGGFSLK